jgi:hypothetical protein
MPTASRLATISQVALRGGGPSRKAMSLPTNNSLGSITSGLGGKVSVAELFFSKTLDPCSNKNSLCVCSSTMP